MTREGPVELRISLPEGSMPAASADKLQGGVPLRVVASGLRLAGMVGQSAVLVADSGQVTVEEDLPPVRPVEPGFCTYCLRAALRRPSGSWWHTDEPCQGVGEGAASFSPIGDD